MEFNKAFFKDSVGWGALLWLMGYVLSFILFMVVPVSLIGWIITPVATLVTLWVLIKKIRPHFFQYYLFIAVTWTILAVILDYLLIVKALKPKDGYYKPDVYVYYALTFMLPLIVGWYKQKSLQQGTTR